MKGIVLKPCFWHWNQGTWLYSLRTAQTCLGLGVSGGLGLPSARGALLSPRGASWQVGRGASSKFAPRCYIDLHSLLLEDLTATLRMAECEEIRA